MSYKKSKKKVVDEDILVAKIFLRLNQEQQLLVEKLRKESAKLWNDVVAIHWRMWKECESWLSSGQLKKVFNAESHKLHSQTIQSVIELHEETCVRTIEMRKQGYKDWKYPYRFKKHFSLRYKKSAIYQSKDGLKLEFSNGVKETRLKIRYPKHIIFDCIKNAEIVFRNGGYWLHLGISKSKLKSVEGGKVAGADPGIIHALTLSDGENHTIITGKALRSAYRFRNKVLAQLQRCISKKVKNSKSYWKLVRRKRKFLEKMTRKIEYMEHCISKMAIEWCKAHLIKTLYVGNPDGVQKHTAKKRRRKINQSLSNWSFGKLFQKLSYKAKLVGISVERQEESYTSGTCPSCGQFKKQTKRTFHCSCGTTGHRDVVGAINIMNKAIHKSFTTNRTIPKWKSVKYLRVLLQPVRKQWC